MAALSIRDLEDDVRERLRVRAASHGRSMEAEVRAILTAAVAADDQGPDLFSALLNRFGALGGVVLEVPGREDSGRPIELSE